MSNIPLGPNDYRNSECHASSILGIIVSCHTVWRFPDNGDQTSVQFTNSQKLAPFKMSTSHIVVEDHTDVITDGMFQMLGAPATAVRSKCIIGAVFNQRLAGDYNSECRPKGLIKILYSESNCALVSHFMI